ncbi:chain length determinant protein EpsF [Thiomicrorhabdus sp.]|uniref:chain length determinant protein EpsF n=1 Tax=Thiomicrorhabdus sp. TaxID=2039724 RepID=UPI0035650390
MSIQQFFLILYARLGIILGVLVVTVVLIGVISLMTPKKYVATSSLMLDFKSPDPVTGQMVQGVAANTYINTQVDILKSKRTVEKVIEMLELGEEPKTVQNWQLATQGKIDFKEWLSTKISKGLTVMTSRESNIIKIEYTDTDPNKAKVLANAFAKAYLNVFLDLKVSPARQYSSFFEEQMSDARKKLEENQKKMSEFLNKNRITAVDNRLDLEVEKLNDLSRQLTQVQSLVAEGKSKRQSGRTETTIEMIQSPVINELKVQIARLEGKLIESNTSLGSNHPQTRALESEVKALQSKLVQEKGNIISSIDTSYEVNLRRESQLKKMLEEQKQIVLDLNQVHDHVSLLKRDVEFAQKAYDVVSQRALQTSLQSQASSTEVSILNFASQPLLPAKPNVVLNLFLAAFLGTILGVTLAILTELTRRRIRSVDDISENLAIPVLGTIGSATGTMKAIKNGAGR